MSLVVREGSLPSWNHQTISSRLVFPSAMTRFSFDMQHPNVAQLARFHRRCGRASIRHQVLRLIITLASIPVIHLGLDYARGQANPETDTRHQALTELLGKGQLVVDLFPPLSYFLPILVPVWALFILDQSCRLLMLYMAVWGGSARTTMGPGPHGGRALLMGLWLGTSVLAQERGIMRQRDSPLELASSLASCLILLGAMPPSFMPSWVGQILVVLSGALGCNIIDWLWCYSLIAVRTVSSIASESQSSPQSTQPLYWTRLIGRTTFALLRIVCLPLLALLSVYSLLFPYSETSSGGNYNLHFLDSTSRRGLLPEEPITLEALGLSKHAKHIPRHAVVSYLPLSLYVPNAGFLWAEPEDIERQTEESAYFSDPFGRRYPWAVEDAMSSTEGLDEEQREFVQSHILPGNLVYLRSRIDGRYLGTLEAEDQAENMILKNQVPGLDEHDPNFMRLWVGMHNEPGQQTTWYLEYDPKRDTGISLYNPHKQCHLATTYIPYGFRSNRTVKEDFRRSYGASCTRSVGISAATIWVIEGISFSHEHFHGHGANTKRLGKLVHEAYGFQDHHSKSKPLVAWDSLYDNLQHGLSIVRAHAALYDWHRRFEVKLDMAPSPLSSPRVQCGWGRWFERLVVGSFLTVHGIITLYRRRTGRPSETNDHVTSPAAVLCWAHVLLYNILMQQRPNSAEVALVMAIRGLLELLSKSLT